MIYLEDISTRYYLMQRSNACIATSRSCTALCNPTFCVLSG